MGKKVSLDEVLGKRKEALGKTTGGSEALFKGSSAPASWNKDDRSAVFVMTTEEQDRDKDIVVQSGIDLTHFLKNPQALLFHNSRTWPVGGWNDVKMVNGRPKRHEGRLKFLPEGGPVKEVDQAAWMVENGGLKAVSIGFMPKEGAIEYVDEEKGWWGGLKFLETELYECSLVPIPAHPSALVKSAAGDMTLAKEFIEEILETYAKDPRTGQLIERKVYEDEYFVLTGSKKSMGDFKSIPFIINADKTASLPADVIKGGSLPVSTSHLGALIVESGITAEKLATMSVENEAGEPLTFTIKADKFIIGRPESKNADTRDEGGEGGTNKDSTQALDGNGDQSEPKTKPSEKDGGSEQQPEAGKPASHYRKSLTDRLWKLLGFKDEETPPEDTPRNEIVPGSLEKAKQALKNHEALLQD